MLANQATRLERLYGCLQDIERRQSKLMNECVTEFPRLKSDLPRRKDGEPDRRRRATRRWFEYYDAQFVALGAEYYKATDDIDREEAREAQVFGERTPLAVSLGLT